MTAARAVTLRRVPREVRQGWQVPSYAIFQDGGLVVDLHESGCSLPITFEGDDPECRCSPHRVMQPVGPQWRPVYLRRPASDSYVELTPAFDINGAVLVALAEIQRRAQSKSPAPGPTKPTKTPDRPAPAELRAKTAALLAGFTRRPVF